jgi:hypothetical protein
LKQTLDFTLFLPRGWGFGFQDVTACTCGAN